MRHRVAFRKLNRTSSHRLAMLGNMVSSLLEHEAIQTTLPKAKEARRVAERIITLGKRGGLDNVRRAARTIHDKGLLQKVFGDLKDRYAERPGGYTRIVRLGYRPGDSAEVALLELVDRVVEEKEAPAKKAKEAREPEEKKAKAEKKPGAEPEKKRGKKKEPAAAQAKTAEAEREKSKASRSRKKAAAEEKIPTRKGKRSKEK
jgi:large subunit ribosomal protein L17